jgi:hypothetical protein
MNKYHAALICLGIALSACRKQPAVSLQNPDSTGVTTALDWQPLAFDYLVLKSKVNFKSKDQNVNATANIRIKRDSIIWISITPGMGIEVLRSIITPDSVKIINRLENKYDKYSIAYLRETLGVDLNFYHLQNLVVGDLLLPLEPQDQVKDMPLEASWKINQDRKNILASSLLSKAQKKITQLEARNQDQKYLRVNYTDFTPADSLIMHHAQSLLMVNGKDSTFIESAHQKIEFSTKPVAFPFSVPKKYEN